MSKPSQWQQRIAGRWHGIPSVFDASGAHQGWDAVSRASEQQGDRITYTMQTDLQGVTGPLRSRFEARGFAFGVRDDGRTRVYMGPDFMGAGHPYGALVDAHYYSPGWRADLRTLVHVLDDGATQVYSSLLYDGPALCAVFNGVYRVSHDYDENADTRAAIEAFLAAERASGPTPHILPYKEEGRFVGTMHVYDAQQQPLDDAPVAIAYRPRSLNHAEWTVEIGGPVGRTWRTTRTRVDHRHHYDGPDLYGNAIAYGRALYTSQHVYGESLKIRGREFLIDDAFTMSAVWDIAAEDQRTFVCFGELRWEPGETVLEARF